MCLANKKIAQNGTRCFANDMSTKQPVGGIVLAIQHTYSKYYNCIVA